MSAELHSLVRDVSASMPDDAIPSDIARVVIEKAGDELRGQFLFEMVTDVVEDVLCNSRRSTMDRIGGGLSKKQQRSRDWWAKAITTERIPVGGGQYRLLRDCTVADLTHCITERQQLIDNTLVQIANYQRLIDLMHTYSVTVVGQLTVEQVQS